MMASWLKLFDCWFKNNNQTILTISTINPTFAEKT